MSTETPWATPLPSPHEDGLPQPGPRAVPRADLAAFAVVAAAGLALAFAVAALWRWAAPAVLGTVSQGSAYLVAPEGKTFVAHDGWYALFACLAALLLAVFAFLRYRAAGSVGAVIGLATGGIAGGYLAAWFGGELGPGRGSISRAVAGVADGKTFALPLTLRATGVIWLWPAVAAGLFFFLVLLFGPNEPQPEEQLFPVWGGPREAEAPPYGYGTPGGAWGESSVSGESGPADGGADGPAPDQPPR
jgi:hypothetical protein